MTTPTESMVTLAAKLEAVGHVSPDIQMTSEEGNRRAREIARATPDEETESMRRLLRARDAYRQELARETSWKDRATVIIANLWPRISHAFVALCIIVVTAGALIVGCAVSAKGVEVPDGIIRGLVMVESGCDWRGIGDVRGKWTHGSDGEVSPFQLSPAALADMGATDRASRIHRDPILAESFARLWLAKCYHRHGNWPDALATYNAGTRYRSRTARDYAERVLALASDL